MITNGTLFICMVLLTIDLSQNGLIAWPFGQYLALLHKIENFVQQMKN